MTAKHRKRIDELKVLHALAERRAVEEEEVLLTAEERLDAVEEAGAVVQGVAQALQNRAHAGIADVVTRCLGVVFDDPYEFKIRFDRKRGKTEARMVLIRDGVELDDPLNEVGGGVVDVAAFALRLACVLLARPRRRRLLVLDEPFSNVRGRGNRARTRAMMEGLSEDLAFQFVLNTDIDAFRLGKVIELS